MVGQLGLPRAPLKYPTERNKLLEKPISISCGAVPSYTYKTKKRKRQRTAVMTKLVYLSLLGCHRNTNPTQLTFLCHVHRHLTTSPHGTRRKDKKKRRRRKRHVKQKCFAAWATVQGIFCCPVCLDWILFPKMYSSGGLEATAAALIFGMSLG
jgi:hypothetical protein